MPTLCAFLLELGMRNTFLYILFFSAIQLNAQDSLNYYYNMGVQGYKNNNLQQYKKGFMSANRLRPYHPTIIYHLARANALLRDDSMTYDNVREMALMNGNLNSLEDSAFVDFNKTELAQKIKDVVKEVNMPIQNSQLFMSVDLRSLHAETMAHDGRRFYLGGVHDRKIIALDNDGSVSSLVDYKQNDKIYAVMGLAYDSVNQLLWACTAALPEMINYSEELEGTSSVIAINDKGEVVKAVTLEGGHLFGDLVIDNNGKVYIADGMDNSIYTISLHSTLERKYDLTSTFINLQGLTFNQEYDQLFVSDYIKGIFKIDIKSGATQQLPMHGDIVAKGFDGIYFYKNSIIGIQNGTNPDRVWRLYLDNNSEHVVKNEIVDQAIECFDEPTQGLLINNKFFYIANSPWSHYNEGKYLENEVTETVILHVPLK